MRTIWLALLCFLTGPVLAVQEITDVLQSGAHVRVAVPEGWRAGDTLLLYQHGFDMDQDTNPDLGPLRDLQLAQGYAIAASGYSQSGWALFRAAQDNRELVDYVARRFGAPGRLITMGGSMGGLIALKLSESPGFENTVGVYALCPPAAGARTWDAAFDLRLAYDAICQGVGGGELLRGDEPLPWAMNLEDIPASLGDLSGSRSVQQTYARIHQCTGIALPNWLRTPPQRDRLRRLMQFGEFSSEDFLLYNLAYATFALGELVRAPDKLAGRNPFTSVGVSYGDSLIDARVPRITADAMAAFDFARASSLTGRIGPMTRIVSLHTDGDELVRLAHQQEIRDRYGSKALSLPIDEAEGTHCGFSAAELVAGWQQLRAWIAEPDRAPDPTAAQAKCAAAIAAGWTGPCRIAPTLAIGDLDRTLRPRDAAMVAASSAATAPISGSWFDPARSGEGVLIERHDERHASVLWFTYPPVGESEELVWLGGIGELQANGIHVENVLRLRGARFGAGFDPNDVVAQSWGSLDVAFDGADRIDGAPRLLLRYVGPANFGSGQLRMQRALPVGPATASGGNRARDWQYSGTWFDPTRSGEGWLLQQSGPPMARLTSVVWFTYDLDRSALWLSGTGYEQDGRLDLTLYRTRGTRFGAAFDAGAIERIPFGRLQIEFDGCDRASLHFSAFDARYGAFGRDLVRLTRPDLVAGCEPP